MKLHCISFFVPILALSLEIDFVSNTVCAAESQYEPLHVLRLISADVGAAQGVSKHGGKFYIYGDYCQTDGEHIGVIREYGPDFSPTGKVVWLKKDGRSVIRHPTGLTFDSRNRAFVGDTVNKQGRIFAINWKSLWQDGDLKNALLTSCVVDDSAHNGSRPEVVRAGGRAFLATADYSPKDESELRIYDIDLMLRHHRTGYSGVKLSSWRCGAYNQSLAWDAAAGNLICVRNVSAGKGWCFGIVRLTRAANGRFHVSSEETVRFDQASELEGFVRIDENKSVFVTSNRRQNVIVANTGELFARLRR